MKWLAFIGLIILAIALILILQQAPRACTEEAKLCPDGTAVGRIPPDCEFAPCPAGEVYCTPESRLADACIEIYQPVCGWFSKDIQCIRYPCADTYSNSCFACMNEQVEYYTSGACPSGAQIANPASVNCVEKGGTLRIVDSPQGQYGMCKLPSGAECEEWAFFRGECP